MLKKSLSITGTMFVLLVTHSVAWAYPVEMPGNNSARHNSMALAGSAIAEGATAIAINPAGLANTEGISADLTANLLMMSLVAPANGPMTESSTFALAPLGYLGAAFRLHDVVVVGFNAYTPAGAGAAYENIDYSGFGFTGLQPKDSSGSMMIIEMGPAVAFNLPYQFKLGVGYRINYIGQGFSGYSAAPPEFEGVVFDNDLSMSGWGFTGFRVGIQWDDPSEVFHAGITYRSPVKVDLEGNSTLSVYMPALSGSTALVSPTADVKSDVTYADKLSLGLGYDVIPHELTLLFDYELDLYERHYKTSTMVLTLHGASDLGVADGTEMENAVEEHPDNRHNFRLGCEYWIIKPLAIRAGFAFHSKARNADYHNPNSGGAPAPTYVAALGAGYWAVEDTLRLDLGYSFLYEVDEVPESEEPRPFAVAGDYSTIAHLIYLGAEFVTN